MRRHFFILEMMRKFELCFEFEGCRGEKFLLPDLLSEKEKDTGNWYDALVFQYHYDILPGSILTRFIVRMHPLISKNTCWRTGVVLISEDGNNRALVRADEDDGVISILIEGPVAGRRGFLEIIRADFHKIHSSPARKGVEERIPLLDTPEVTVGYEHLRVLEDKGISEFFPEGATENYSVKGLLDGIERPEMRKRWRPGSIHTIVEPVQQMDQGTGNNTGRRIDDQDAENSAIPTPAKFLQEAIKAVPSVKWALGIGGIASVIAIVKGFGLDLRVAGFGVPVMIVLMTALVVFARASTFAKESLRWPALALTWFVLLLFMAISICLFSSVFFEWPVDLKYWLAPA